MGRLLGLGGAGTVTAEKSKVPRAKRFGFSLAKDIALLKATLQLNPFKLGSGKWQDVASEMKTIFKDNVTERTVKERVFHLKKLYETQQLCFKTETEEEKSERGKLIENIIELHEESVALINVELGANEELAVPTAEPNPAANGSKQPSPAANGSKQQRAERVKADEERDAAANDLAPEPQPKRKKQRLMPEDELIKMKMEHDMKLEDDRLKLEEEKMHQDHEMETKRLDLEMKRFEFEQEKEKRLNEESKRKDELSLMQLGFQEHLMKVLAKLVDK